MISATCRRARSAAVPCVMSYLFPGAAPILGGVASLRDRPRRVSGVLESVRALQALVAPRGAGPAVTLRHREARADGGLGARRSRGHWSDRGVAAVHHHGRAGDV